MQKSKNRPDYDSYICMWAQCQGNRFAYSDSYDHGRYRHTCSALSIGLGFTQVPDMFNIFPNIIRTIFAENCVAVVFPAAIIMNLVLPKDEKEKV